MLVGHLPQIIWSKLIDTDRQYEFWAFSRNMTIAPQTEYLNTDLELQSDTAFDLLAQELDQTCCLLNHCQTDSGFWAATIEAECSDDGRALQVLIQDANGQGVKAHDCPEGGFVQLGPENNFPSGVCHLVQGTCIQGNCKRNGR